MRSSGEALKACRDLLKSKLEFSMVVGRGKRWQNRCVGASWPPGLGQVVLALICTSLYCLKKCCFSVVRLLECLPIDASAVLQCQYHMSKRKVYLKEGHKPDVDLGIEAGRSDTNSWEAFLV